MSEPSLVLDGEPVSIRPMDEDDRNYIIATWMRSYKPFAGVNSSQLYDTGQSALILKLMAKSRMFVACYEEIPTGILGWASGYTDGSINYVYVRKDLRGKGLAKELITATIRSYPDRIYITHIPTIKCQRFIYNPYPLMGAK